MTESPRPGAPMTLIRGGEERDLQAIVAMGQVRASAFRFHLDRDVDLVQARDRAQAAAGRSRRTARARAAFLHRRGRHHRGRLRRHQHRRLHSGRSRNAATATPPARASAPCCRRCRAGTGRTPPVDPGLAASCLRASTDHDREGDAASTNHEAESPWLHERPAAAVRRRCAVLAERYVVRRYGRLEDFDEQK